MLRYSLKTVFFRVILFLYSNTTVVLGHVFNLLPEAVWETLSSSNCLKHATLPTNPTLLLKEQRWKKTLKIQTVNPQSRNVEFGRWALVWALIVLAGIFFHVFSVILSLAHCVIIKTLLCLFVFILVNMEFYKMLWKLRKKSLWF